MDTIVATSSGRPPAAIAIVRVSGGEARGVVAALAARVPAPRVASLRALRDADGGLLDRALVLWFPHPASATGEDVAEFHVHGGRAVVAAVEAAILRRPGVRRAEAGEFTRRALLSGRIDMAQAEGLADLLEAETEAQRRAAIAAAEGAFGRELATWSDAVAMVRARVEAAIDYADEGDVPIGPVPVAMLLAPVVAEMAAVLDRPGVERLRDGFRVVIAGPPNVGKSTLFNALLERDAAIVADVAGTTRDRLEQDVVRRGVAFALSDTAGLRAHTDDAIEREGIRRSGAAIDGADMVLWLDDAAPPDPRYRWLYPRSDEPGRGEPPVGAVPLASRDRASVDRVWRLIDAAAGERITIAAYHLHERQRTGLADARDALLDAARGTDALIVAEELRHAARALAALTGIDASEAMLDALFGRFCIGK